MSKKDRKIGDIFYDRRDGGCFKTTLIAIDNKGRYITEVEGLEGVFAEDHLDRAEEIKNDWINKLYNHIDLLHKKCGKIFYMEEEEFRNDIEKYIPQYDVDHVLYELMNIPHDRIVEGCKSFDLEKTQEKYKAILQKYDLKKPQKKFSRGEIKHRYRKKYGQVGNLIENKNLQTIMGNFLDDMGMLD